MESKVLLRKVYKFLLISLIISLIIGAMPAIFSVIASLNHNPQGEYCDYAVQSGFLSNLLGFDDCSIRWVNLFYVFAAWFVAIAKYPAIAFLSIFPVFIILEIKAIQKDYGKK
ncbi:MAG: hypothetical protein GY804_15595 [Alphaproteobacteria bacterium]|nr:hypothetical protein [Alphaproteobacteria bacterium]